MITNPILPGDYISDKSVVLDINVVLNDERIINLEMQIANLHDWTERSVYYLCRNYCNLKKGDEYGFVRPVHHIGIMDYTLFPENPEFYATFCLKNVKNGKVYTDKMQLSVLDLTKIKNATEEDRRNHIDIWAEVFKAGTWEDFRMMAKDNTAMLQAGATMYALSEEEMTRIRCEQREKALMDELARQHRMERYERAEQKYKENEQKYKENEQKYKENEQKYQENIADLETRLARAELLLKEHGIAMNGDA